MKCSRSLQVCPKPTTKNKGNKGRNTPHTPPQKAKRHAWGRTRKHAKSKSRHASRQKNKCRKVAENVWVVVFGEEKGKGKSRQEKEHQKCPHGQAELCAQEGNAGYMAMHKVCVVCNCVAVSQQERQAGKGKGREEEEEKKGEGKRGREETEEEEEEEPPPISKPVHPNSPCPPLHPPDPSSQQQCMVGRWWQEGMKEWCEKVSMCEAGRGKGVCVWRA